MQYYLISPSVVPDSLGFNTLTSYLKNNVENYIDLTSNFEEPTVLSTSMVRAVAPDDVKIVDLITNSYNRAFLYYLDYVLPNRQLTKDLVQSVATPAGFKDFVKSAFAFSEDYKVKRTNHCTEIRAGVDYLISAESYASDLQNIPELASVSTVSALEEHQWLYGTMYRDYYDEEVKQIVSEVYAGDIDAYGYVF